MLDSIHSEGKSFINFATKLSQRAKVMSFLVENIDKEPNQIRELAADTNKEFALAHFDKAQIQSVRSVLKKHYNIEKKQENPDQALLNSMAQCSHLLKNENPYDNNNIIFDNVLGAFTDPCVKTFLKLNQTNGPEKVNKSFKDKIYFFSVNTYSDNSTSLVKYLRCGAAQKH